MPQTVIVVPCYNEARRLAVSDFARHCEREPSVRFVFVDDGSRDGTDALLRELASQHEKQVTVVALPHNVGKAEAVRSGMREALSSPCRYAGYWDADLATPLEEIPRFVAALDARPQCLAVLGSRVKLMGREIERRAVRHYPGRIFATLASLTLGLAVYDTQCGAKLFRNTPDLCRAFERPFLTRWIFDVELIARLVEILRDGHGPDIEEALYELPLNRWRDVAGSKVGPVDFFRALAELLRIRLRYRPA